MLYYYIAIILISIYYLKHCVLFNRIRMVHILKLNKIFPRDSRVKCVRKKRPKGLHVSPKLLVMKTVPTVAG